MKRDKTTPAHWMGRPIVAHEHVQDLETRSAINEFHHRMPRHQAEQKAHDDYVKEQRERAAAHHLHGMKAAQAVGNHEDARKHWAMYDLHLHSLGAEPVGAVPPEVERRLQEEGSKPVYKFKAHQGDLFAIRDPAKDVAQVPGEQVAKSEDSASTGFEHGCAWKLGERRCKLPGTRKSGGKFYCHHHEHHWSNKIAKNEHEQLALDLLNGTWGILEKAVKTQKNEGDMHSTVEGFMSGLRTLPKGSPARGKFITAHMNHGPFLRALQSHPQGKQLHATMTAHLNGVNAAMQPGRTVATAKRELSKGDVVPFPKEKVSPGEDKGKVAVVAGAIGGHGNKSVKKIYHLPGPYNGSLCGTGPGRGIVNVDPVTREQHYTAKSPQEARMTLEHPREMLRRGLCPHCARAALDKR